MYSPEVTIIAAGTGALILGLGLGFRLGKLYGMKLGIAARDFAESFGIGKQGMQAGVGTPIGGAATPPYNLPQQAVVNQIISRGGGGGGGSSHPGPYVGGGGGGAGGYDASALGAKPNWQSLYQNAVATGMLPVAAQQLLINEIERYRQQEFKAKIAAIDKMTPKSKGP